MKRPEGEVTNVFRNMIGDFKKPAGIVGVGYLTSALAFLVLLALLFIADGTGDEGDSVAHYLLARYAWVHPRLFLDHWGKPVFTLIASPFAQYGLPGIKFFNVCVSISGLVCAQHIADRLGIRRAFLIPLMALGIPYFTRYTLSGLTEPMFNTWILAGIWLLLSGRRTGGILWFSFLPFVRSEGLVVLVVLAVYLVVNRGYKWLPFLLTGHLVYACAGALAGKPFLWVFTEMTYAALSSGYGNGSWGWFFVHFPEMLGWVAGFLVVAGMVRYGYRMLSSLHDRTKINYDLLFLVYGLSTGVFIFHVVAWGMGWFNSFGLLRVMVGILGLFLLIALQGFNLLVEATGRRWRHAASFVVMLVFLAVPLGYKNNGYDFRRQFMLNASQRAIDRAARFIKEHYRDYRDHTYAYQAPYLALALNIDPFNEDKMKDLLDPYVGGLPAGTIIVWDDWYAPQEGGVTPWLLDTYPQVSFVRLFSEKEHGPGKPSRLCAVYYKDW